ncbi:MAG: diguanylate cyclase [Magnetococcales bacterium]|nr:diguanylate cyclase [Magnetococcales bacterium]
MARILVVDDDSQAIEQTARLITTAGHEADFLLESQYLLSKLEVEIPDLLLLDVNMPEIDGVTLLKRIQANPHLKKMPIIMITGESEESLIQECFNLGAVDFVNKPIRPLELLSRIRIALKTSAYIQAIHSQKNALQRAKSFTDAILDSMKDAICVIDQQTHTILEANRVCLEHLGLPRHKVIGKTCVEVLLQKSHACLQCTGSDQDPCILQETMAQGLAFREVSTTGRDQKPQHTKIYTFPIRNETGMADRIICLERDVTKTKELENRLQHLAFHDPLTHLPNRQLFDDRLQQALAQGRRHSQIVAVMLFDLDHFKQINDTLGHHAGDLLLQEVAKRLNACIRESDTVARMGGDEFTAVLTNVTDGAHVRRVARKFLKELSRHFILENHKMTITTSIGVSLYPEDGDEMLDLLNKADKALYQAKSVGRNNVQFFSQLEPKR